MKLLYKLIFFFMILHITILMINSLGVFPNTLYSDEETREYDFNDPNDILLYLFPAMDGTDNILFSILTGGFVTLASLAALLVSLKTGNFGVVIVTLIGASFVPMILSSLNLFKKILYVGDSQAMIYLAACFSICIIFLIVITMLETITHGRSG